MNTKITFLYAILSSIICVLTSYINYNKECLMIVPILVMVLWVSVIIPNIIDYDKQTNALLDLIYITIPCIVPTILLSSFSH